MSKVLAIGDIHTKIWIIEKVSKVINNYDRIIFCGDYADDFNASPQDTLNTWGLLKDLQIKYRNKIGLIIGNHDYIYVYNTPSLQTGYNPITHTLINAPENKNLREWLASLPIIIKIDGVAYSHAGITKEWSGADDVSGLWNNTSPIWARPGSSTTYKSSPQVFGHTPSETCREIKDRVWCIDTFSTYPDGRLFGDGSVLQIIDGKKFSKLYLK
ncbi:MAG TPA: metallophosphoesterase [Candidatus Dormibacteraeota bacterium]|nr:metallophosphoesterase [Candidatus Dormibacteraeota bacterium]